MNIKKAIYMIGIVTILILSNFTYSCAVTPSYVWSGDSSGLLEIAAHTETDLKLESGGAILIEQSTGTVLYEHNSHEKYRPASVTKVMSLLLIMEAIDSRRIKVYRQSYMFRKCSFYGWIANLARSSEKLLQ